MRLAALFGRGGDGHQYSCEQIRALHRGFSKELSQRDAVHGVRHAVQPGALIYYLPARAICVPAPPSIHLRTRRASATRVSLPNELSSTMTVGRCWMVVRMTRH